MRFLFLIWFRFVSVGIGL